MTKVSTVFLVGFSLMSASAALAQTAVSSSMAGAVQQFSSATDRTVELGVSRGGLGGVGLQASTGAAMTTLPQAPAEPGVSVRFRDVLGSGQNPLAGGLGANAFAAAFGSDGSAGDPPVQILLGANANVGSAIAAVTSEQPPAPIRIGQ